MAAVYLSSPDVASVSFVHASDKLVISTRYSISGVNIHKVYNTTKGFEIYGDNSAVTVSGTDEYELALPLTPYREMCEDGDEINVTFKFDQADIDRLLQGSVLEDTGLGVVKTYSSPLTVEFPAAKGLIAITADDINGTEGDEEQLYLSLGGATSWADLRWLACVKNIALPATTIAKSLGDAQSADVETAVLIEPVVIVTNGLGEPIEGVSVTFAIASGSGTIEVETAVLTDAEGLASGGAWTLGAVAGANTLTATSAGLTGSPLTFTATGVAV